MCFVYVSENGASIGINGGNMIVTHQTKEVDRIPKNDIDGISIFGKSYMTAEAIKHCLENSIPVSFMTQAGRYLGRLSPADDINISRQRKQFIHSAEDEFSLCLARRIVNAKINNQIVVAKRYLLNADFNGQSSISNMLNSRKKVLFAKSRSEIMGYEGIASKEYFSLLSNLIGEDFKFVGRNRRPAMDPFNAMIGFGYSMLTKEICGELENRGLNPYVGFLHREKEGHPALASDMIEEWRATIVDSVVLSLIRGNEISIDEFENEGQRCIISKSAMHKLLVKFEKRMHSTVQYLSYIEKPVSFRQAIWHQAERMAKTIDCNNPYYYEPIYIR